MGSVVTHAVDLHSSPTFSITRHHNSDGAAFAFPLLVRAAEKDSAGQGVTKCAVINRRQIENVESPAVPGSFMGTFTSNLRTRDLNSFYA